ncbi:MAG: hypothetical protein DME25_12595 [Verrucomicrobia bacterium]|nr:MAG: hypothetical protein DME25_12595 [Verrucomicrobiota bacterium]
MPDGTVTNGSPRVVILGPGESLARQPFDPSFAGGTLASIKYDYSGSATQSMTLAFLGTVDGTFNELDLDMGIQLLGNVLLPALKNDDTNLFIGVDLTQWQSFPTNFNALDTFTFAGGTNDALPGFLIGTSEVALGADGYETASPFSGEVYVAGAIDGEVPEPGIGALLWTGVLLTTWQARRRHKLKAA